eukprot:SAG11_NODE_5212_length_1628_cov_2.835840_2_plen_170_part_00
MANCSSCAVRLHTARAPRLLMLPRGLSSCASARPPPAAAAAKPLEGLRVVEMVRRRQQRSCTKLARTHGRASAHHSWLLLSLLSLPRLMCFRQHVCGCRATVGGFFASVWAAGSADRGPLHWHHACLLWRRGDGAARPLNHPARPPARPPNHSARPPARGALGAEAFWG